MVLNDIPYVMASGQSQVCSLTTLLRSYPLNQSAYRVEIAEYAV